MKKEMNYEQAIARLETIVSQLEKGQVDLADSMTLYQEGVSLIQYCEQTLQQFEQSMVQVYEDGQLQEVEKEAL